MTLHFAAAPVVWLTGLSGAGKTSIAKGVCTVLYAQGVRSLLLDGDQLRAGLSKDLGFSMPDRSENIRRAAEVAALVSRAGVPVIAALISPLEHDRAVARASVGAQSFVEVYVEASLAVVEARDTKGLYARARRGEIADFTGISSPYEPPQQPKLRINTGDVSLNDSIALVVALLRPWFTDQLGPQ